MTWLRTSFRAVVIATALAGTAIAQPSNAQRANSLNDEGKAAMGASNFALASEKFNQAILLSPEGRFYFNLCVAEYSQGQLSKALEACKAVDAAGADETLRGKTSKMTAKIKDDIRKLGFDPDAPVADPNGGTQTDPNGGTQTDPNGGTQTDPNGGTQTDPNGGTQTDPNGGTQTDPNGGNPNTGRPPTGPAIVAPPPMSVIKAGAPEHQYTWTLGGELLGGNANFGRGGYTSGVYGFRFLGDYLIAPGKQLGAQATIGVLHTDEGDVDAGIDVVDVGIAGYKHFCRGRACVTPLLGVSLGLMQPDEIESSDALLAVGIRAEARIGFALGKRFEHLISLTLGFQGYTRAFDSSNIDAIDYGLDKGSTIGLVAVGYTYRFNTPFGSSPFVTLE
jgi:hypothetical protein